MTTLQIIFFGLICFFGSGNDPRMVIVFDVSKGENVHGHKVESHAALIRVRPDDVVRQKTDWPCTGQKCTDFALDNRTLEISGIEDKRLVVDPNHERLVPHIRTECPDLAEKKDDAALKSAAAANLTLSYGTLCAHQSKQGAISSVYAVKTKGETTITGKRDNQKDRVLVLKANAIIEIRNEPAGPGGGNHFIAYYKRIAKNEACCTNLPFRALKKSDRGCDLPKGPTERIISTVACSNSNYP